MSNNPRKQKDSLYSFEKIDSSEESSSNWKRFPNLKAPGRIEKLSHMRELMEIKKFLFSGFLLQVQYLISRNFIVGHAIALGKDDMFMMKEGEDEPERGSYSFTGQYVGKNYHLNGMFSLGGVSQSMFQFKKGGFGILLNGQAVGENFAFELDSFYQFHDSLIEARLQTKEMGLAFTQAITPNLAFGSEYMIGQGYVYNKFIFRYKDREARTKKTISITKGTNKNELRLYYSKKATKNLEFLSAYRLTKKKNYTSNWYFGYLSKSQRAMVKSLMDGTGNISTLVEMPFSSVSSLSICGNINYRLNSYDFGFGISLMV